MTAKLEICVDDVSGIDAAVWGGADRIELCSALSLGGLTPTPALVARAVASGLPVHAMVRPRAGDFVYDDDEIAVMLDDIGRLVAMGVTGIVMGASRTDGMIDTAVLARLREAAAPCAAVLHRAIDLTPDPCAAVEDAVSAGFDFVLSSGGAATALEGAATLRAMIGRADGRIVVIGGSGIAPDNVGALIAATGLRNVHASASEATEWIDSRVEMMGFANGPRRSTVPEKVAAIKAAIHAQRPER